MSGQLRAQSISIQVSTRTKCIAKCRGCIAASTQNSAKSDDEGGVVQVCKIGDVDRGLRFAKRLSATHAILTSKADPLQEDKIYLLDLIRACAKRMPVVDIHTNGWLLTWGNIMDFRVAGLSMLTLSVSHHIPKINQKFMGGKAIYLDSVVEEARNLGLLVRVSLLLHDEGVQDFEGLMEYIEYFGEMGVHMVVVRELWAPHGSSSSQLDWSEGHKVYIQPIESEVDQLAVSGLEHEATGKYVSLRSPLPWGQQVYSVSGFRNKDYGVNLTFSRCDDGTCGSLIKSIVHRPDGHGYRSWASNGDILY